MQLHPGVFALVQGGTRDAGQRLVQHPLIRAVGFTGSLWGGRALFDLCAARPEPIPFFGELGSINPMFLMPGAIDARSDEIAAGWAASLTMGAGQFCTNPGVAVIVAGSAADGFIKATEQALSQIGGQVMLTEGIAKSYRSGCHQIAGEDGVDEVLSAQGDTRTAVPHLYQTSGANWLANPALAEEVFGPLGLVVKVKDLNEMRAVAQRLKGQLTCTVHMDDDDSKDVQDLLPVLQRKAGRILVNGFPTGVEVSDAMIHGGPFPASTNFGHTSVGTLVNPALAAPCLLSEYA